MKICRAAFALICLAVSCSFVRFAAAGDVPQQQAAPAFRQELLNTQKAFLDAMDRGDVNYVKAAVADNFMQIETTGDSSGKSELLHGLKPEKPGSKPILYQFDVLELDSDCAVVTYNAVFHGSPIDRYQHLSYTWVKQDGQWKLKFQQTTVNLWSAHDLD